MSNAQVSVIIPTYNRARLIRRAAESVLAQTFGNFELVVVDDGSRDDTAAVIASLRDARVTYTRHDENRGQNAALNTGVRAATGEFCAFLDSDDAWEPTYLARVMERFELEPSLGCVYTMAGILSASGTLAICKRFDLEGDIYPRALAQGYVSHMITLVARRKLLHQVGLFDEEFEVCQDDDICLRLAREATFGLIREPLAIIHRDAGDQATRNPAKYAEGAWRLVGKFALEIETRCGAATLAGHYERCGDLFWLARDREMALAAYARAAALRASLATAVRSCAVRLGFSPFLAVRLKQLLNIGKRGEP